jgi:hypothetical protein
MYMGLTMVRQTEIHTGEPLVPEPRSFKVEITIEKLKRYKSLHTGKIPTDPIHILINSVWNKENCHSSGRNLLLYLFIKRVMKLTVVIIEGYNHYQLHKIFSNILLSRLMLRVDKITVDHRCGF